MPEYDVGVDRGVLYISGMPGEPWVGLTGITENPKDSEERTRYIDGVKNRFRRTVGSFSGVISAYTYPDLFYEHALTQQRRKNFGLSYRVMHEKTYKIHLVYNARISPEEISRKQFETEPFQWNFTTIPVEVPENRRSAHLIIDSAKAYSWTIEALENILYGDESLTARLPSPFEVFEIFEENSILRVIDNGDGSFTVNGPDSAIQMLDDTTFQIDWPSAVYIDENSYTIHSL